MGEEVQPKVKLSIFSLDLLDNQAVTVSLFPPIAKSISEKEIAEVVEAAKKIERICFTVMQRSPEFSQPGKPEPEPKPESNVSDIRVAKTGRRKKKKNS